MLETWALEIVLALAAAQLLVFFLLYRRRTRSTASGSTATATADTDGSSIECSACGAENDPAYRYCRRCVSDLSGESIPGSRGYSPSKRSF